MILKVFSVCNNYKCKWISYFEIDNGYYYAYKNYKYWELYQKNNVSNSITGSRDDKFLQVYNNMKDLEFNLKRLTRKQILG
jgi:hypothetical protein